MDNIQDSIPHTYRWEINRGRIISIFFTFALIGFPFLAAGMFSTENGQQVGLIIVGGIFLFLALLGIVFFMRQEVYLAELSPEGISIRGSGFIAWENIESVGIQNTQKSKKIFFRLRDIDDFFYTPDSRKKVSDFKRDMHATLRKHTGFDAGLTINFAKLSPAELAEDLQSYAHRLGYNFPIKFFYLGDRIFAPLVSDRGSTASEKEWP